MKRRRRRSSSDKRPLCYCENGQFVVCLFLPRVMYTAKLKKYGCEPMVEGAYRQSHAFLRETSLSKLELAVAKLHKEVFQVPALQLDPQHFIDKNHTELAHEDTPLPRRRRAKRRLSS